MFRNGLFKAIGSLLANGGLVYAGLKQQQKNYQWYQNLAPEQQKKVYESCPAQKFSYGADFFAAVQERTDTLDSQRHRDTPPKIPHTPVNSK